MRINTFAASVAFAVMASAGFAQSINPGVAQLAAQAGVNPANYSQAQIVELINAQRDNDSTTVNAILAQGKSGVTASAASQPSTGNVQLARLAGVAPGQYTDAELSQLVDARRDGDTGTVAFILSHGSRDTAESANNAGRLQLASIAGVNAADYTLSQLTDMTASD